ncbi:hypothetical protein F4803DRAFT_535736 [Xylaria telfairii]|nr:hypothetical protein F4803DRAFT_535736 [Xylaria telfairii]
MRPSTVFTVLAVTAYSSPIPQQLGLLGGLTGLTGLTNLGGITNLGGLVPLGTLSPLTTLTDSLINTVGELLRAPLDILNPLLGGGVVPCGIDARLCVGTCTAECTGSAQAVSDMKPSHHAMRTVIHVVLHTTRDPIRIARSEAKLLTLELVVLKMLSNLL